LTNAHYCVTSCWSNWGANHGRKWCTDCFTSTQTYAIECKSLTTLAFDLNLPNMLALLCSFKTTDGHEVKLVNLWTSGVFQHVSWILNFVFVFFLDYLYGLFIVWEESVDNALPSITPLRYIFLLFYSVYSHKTCLALYKVIAHSILNCLIGYYTLASILNQRKKLLKTSWLSWSGKHRLDIKI